MAESVPTVDARAALQQICSLLQVVIAFLWIGFIASTLMLGYTVFLGVRGRKTPDGVAVSHLLTDVGSALIPSQAWSATFANCRRPSSSFVKLEERKPSVDHVFQPKQNRHRHQVEDSSQPMVNSSEPKAKNSSQPTLDKMDCSNPFETEEEVPASTGNPFQSTQDDAGRRV